MTAVDDFIEAQPEPQRSVIRLLRRWMHQASPQMREKIRYNLPFFDCPRWFCYVNPLRKGGVELCFLRGNELSNEHGLLEARDRQTVRGVTLLTVEETLRHETALRELIAEALLREEHHAAAPAGTGVWPHRSTRPKT